MLKKTLLVTQIGYISSRYKQLIFKPNESEEIISIPFEDIGIIIIENFQVTITSATMANCSMYGISVVFCDEKHMPSSITLNLDGNNRQTKIVNSQLDAKKPLKKQLWKKIIEQKIMNQALLLKKYDKKWKILYNYSKEVLSDDSTNREGVAAQKYWSQIMPTINFKRDYEGSYPNNFLNYGYAILRAATARSLTSSGLLPIIGLHHKNQYNPFCLADDVMEPYRPFIDEVVIEIIIKNKGETELTKTIKAEICKSLTCDTTFGEYRRPMLMSIQESTASLANCFLDNTSIIKYPQIIL